MTNAMYLRVSAKSNPLMVKLQLAYQDRFDEMKEEQLLCCDLERRMKDISFSFVACLFEAISAQIKDVWASLELAPHTKFSLQQPYIPHASQASEAANYCPELRKNGFHLEANYTQALTDASNTLRKTCESRSSKLVLHLDELNLFAVHKDFKRQDDQGSVSRDDWPGYRLISLSDAIYSELGGSLQLRVVFSGTSRAAGYLLRFATELKPAKIPPLRETSVEFVDHVLRHFPVLDHLDPDYVHNLCARLAGCCAARWSVSPPLPGARVRCHRRLRLTHGRLRPGADPSKKIFCWPVLQQPDPAQRGLKACRQRRSAGVCLLWSLWLHARR